MISIGKSRNEKFSVRRGGDCSKSQRKKHFTNQKYMLTFHYLAKLFAKEREFLSFRQVKYSNIGVCQCINFKNTKQYFSIFHIPYNIQCTFEI